MDRASIARVGVVIVTYASADDISFALQTLPTADLARVVVADNDSPDATVDVVRALKLPNVTVVEQANVGFGAGVNAGRKHLPADTPFVLILNPDCVVAGDDIARLVDYLDAHPRCAVAAPRLRDRQDRPLTSAGNLPTLRSELQPHLPRALGRLLPRRRHEGACGDSGPVGYVEGACMLVRAEAFDEVGGFDERYFLCFEEIDLARRLQENRWTTDLCAAAWATHGVQGSRSQRPLFSLYHQYRGQRLYLERWAGARAAARFAVAAGLSWRVRRVAGKLTQEQCRVMLAGVSKADFPV